jgi:hypothetical protein
LVSNTEARQIAAWAEPICKVTFFHLAPAGVR